MKARTAYLICQGTKETTDDHIRALLKHILKADDPSTLLSKGSKAPVRLSRIYHLPNTAPTKVAEVIAETLGDDAGQPGEVGLRYFVGRGGATKKQTVVPTRDDLRGKVAPGDWVTFERLKQEAEDEENNALWVAHKVDTVYKESLELVHPGLKHKVTKSTPFYISRFSRALPAPLLNVGGRAKNVSGFIRHQPLDGSMFTFTKGDLMKVIPFFFAEDDTASAETLSQVLNTMRRPWAVQVTYKIRDGEPALAEKSLLTVFTMKGSTRPLAQASMWPLFFILLLCAGATVFFCVSPGCQVVGSPLCGT